MKIFTNEVAIVKMKFRNKLIIFKWYQIISIMVRSTHKPHKIIHLMTHNKSCHNQQPHQLYLFLSELVRILYAVLWQVWQTTVAQNLQRWVRYNLFNLNKISSRSHHKTFAFVVQVCSCYLITDKRVLII